MARGKRGSTKDDTAIRALVPTKVRLIVQGRKPQLKGEQDTYYSPVPGHVLLVPVRTLREFRRLWAAIEAVVDRGGWRDVSRSAADRVELPGADLSDVGDQP
jgi:hypothetical protein